MKLTRFHLLAYGPFSNVTLNFCTDRQSLVLIYGPNEAGKSSMLRALTELRYAIYDRTTDDFIHYKRDLRLGGEFIDQSGKTHQLLRTKQRGTSLFYTDFDVGALPREPVPPSVEQALTGGLSKAEYETMYGLNHARLRVGGAELAAGQGDVGKSLFQAAAGIHSLQQICEGLQDRARTFYMTGASAKNATINAAIIRYDSAESACKKAVFRPTAWADLSAADADATEKVAELDAQLRAARETLYLAKELRAVAPNLRRLDQAAAVLAELSDVPVLSESATADRTTAQSRLEDAQTSVRDSSAELAEVEAALSVLVRDPAVLAMSAAINHLSSAILDLDNLQMASNDAQADAQAANALVTSIAGRIDARCTPQEMVANIPSEVTLEAVREQLGAIESATHALSVTRADLEELSKAAAKREIPNLPPAEALQALQAAIREVSEAKQTFDHLNSLPLDIRQRTRQLQAMLAALEIPDEELLRAVKLMLDSRIDETSKEFTQLDATIESLEQQLSDAFAETDKMSAQRHQLTATGTVPTHDDLMAARAQRDVGWSLVRRHLTGDSIDLGAEAEYGDEPIHATFERAMAYADTLADGYAGDIKRSTALQVCQYTLADLDAKRAYIEQEIVTTKSRRSTREESWYAELEAASLPRLAPDALREWQTRCSDARELAEHLAELNDRHEYAKDVAAGLCHRLRKAMTAVGTATLPESASLGTLMALAEQANADIQRDTATINEQLGAQRERSQQQKRLAERETEHTLNLEHVTSALASLLPLLKLPPDSSPSTVSARLKEFVNLQTANERLQDALASKVKAAGRLSRIADDAQRLAEALSDTVDADLRVFTDRMERRLDAARQADSDHAQLTASQEKLKRLLKQAEADVTAQSQILRSLCQAAQVTDIDALPSAEEASSRKRHAQQAHRDATDALAAATHRPHDFLRAMIGDKSVEVFQSDEETAAEKVENLERQLHQAQESAAAARRMLDAVDTSNEANAQREKMEQALAAIDMSLEPWIRSRLGAALLNAAMQRFRERAQGPMLKAAIRYFNRMTDDRFERIVTEDEGGAPVLMVERRGSDRLLPMTALSEGTCDQLYLSLRMAALEMQRSAGVNLPVVFDDLLMTSDDERAVCMLRALEEFSRGSQVVVMTHHAHLMDLARKALPAESLMVIDMTRSVEGVAA